MAGRLKPATRIGASRPCWPGATTADPHTRCAYVQHAPLQPRECFTTRAEADFLEGAFAVPPGLLAAAGFSPCGAFFRRRTEHRMNSVRRA